MAHESIYAHLTPESHRRSRTGAVLAQLLGETNLELTGACLSRGAAESIVFHLAGENAEEMADRVAGSIETRGSLRGRFASTDDPVVEIRKDRPSNLHHHIGGYVEQTLVLLKPDNFEYPSIRPGALVDHFARTGLRLAALKVHHMSVAEAEDFYAPVLPVLEEAFKESHGNSAADFLDREYEESLFPGERRRIAETVGPVMGRRRWETLIEFMTGSRPSQMPDADKNRPGTRKCLALVYEGERAIDRIRSTLGPTDPAKAPPGTIRREFGRTLMVNAAHASDSAASVEREMAIIRMRDNPMMSPDS